MMPCGKTESAIWHGFCFYGNTTHVKKIKKNLYLIQIVYALINIKWSHLIIESLISHFPGYLWPPFLLFLSSRLSGMPLFINIWSSGWDRKEESTSITFFWLFTTLFLLSMCKRLNSRLLPFELGLFPQVTDILIQ